MSTNGIANKLKMIEQQNLYQNEDESINKHENVNLGSMSSNHFKMDINDEGNIQGPKKSSHISLFGQSSAALE